MSVCDVVCVSSVMVVWYGSSKLIIDILIVLSVFLLTRNKTVRYFVVCVFRYLFKQEEGIQLRVY